MSEKQQEKRIIWEQLQKAVGALAREVGARAKALHMGAAVHMGIEERNRERVAADLRVSPAGKVTAVYTSNTGTVNTFGGFEEDPSTVGPIPRKVLHETLAHMRELVETLEGRLDQQIQADKEGIAAAEALLEELRKGEQ